MGVTVQLLNRVLLHRDVGLNSIFLSALLTVPTRCWTHDVRTLGRLLYVCLAWGSGYEEH